MERERYRERGGGRDRESERETEGGGGRDGGKVGGGGREGGRERERVCVTWSPGASPKVKLGVGFTSLFVGLHGHLNHKKTQPPRTLP